MTSRAGALGLLAAGVIGLASSLYLTAAHYTDVPLACATNTAIDCAAVTTSGWSLIPGTSAPVAAAGVLWFVVSIALAAAALRAEPSLLVARAALAWSVAGVLAVLYLVYGELVVIHRICEWCTVAHVAVLFSLLLAQLRLAALDPASG